MLSAGPVQGLSADAPLPEKARSVLQQHCLSCHGETRISGLDLRQRESLLKGGNSGPAIVPGHPEESLLYQAVLQTGELKMPVGGALSPEEVGVLREWIQAGAPWEEDPHGSNGISTWWSFQALGDPEAPEVRDPGWVRTPVDAFVLRKLEEKGLDPAPRAGKLTLLRRAKFDLHGLPPTEQEIKQFLGDKAPGAFARLVDRLLASPRYGERWGRHWLDVARYADSSGLDEDITMPYAWRFRDYVVDSFNRDLPYDRFVKDQIAGDLYPSGRPGHPNVRAVLGTGFLAIGPRAIAQQDKTKMVYDLVDEQIDTLSKAFLGLTIACARCHDHKFDPISTRDYYSLASIFASTRSFGVLIPPDKKPPFVSKFYFEPLVPKEVHQRYRSHQDKIKGRESLIEALVQTGVAGNLEEKLYPLLAEYMLAARRVYLQGESLKQVADAEDLDPQLLQRWIEYLQPGNAFRPYLEKWHRAESSQLARVAEEYQDLFDRLSGEWHQRLRQWKQKVEQAVREGKAPYRKPAFADGFITDPRIELFPGVPNEVCERSGRWDPDSGDPLPDGCLDGFDIALFKSSFVNRNAVETSGLDFNVDWRHEFAGGNQLGIRLLGAYVQSFKISTLDGTLVETVGTDRGSDLGLLDNPKIRANLITTYSTGDHDFRWSLRFTDGIELWNPGRFQYNTDESAWMQHDLVYTYTLPSANQLNVAILNATNNEPPLVANSLTTVDSRLHDPRMRMFRLEYVHSF